METGNNLARFDLADHDSVLYQKSISEDKYIGMHGCCGCCWGGSRMSKETSDWQKAKDSLLDEALCGNPDIEGVQVSYTKADILVSPTDYHLPEIVITVEEL